MSNEDKDSGILSSLVPIESCIEKWEADEDFICEYEALKEAFRIYKEENIMKRLEDAEYTRYPDIATFFKELELEMADDETKETPE